MPLKTVESSSSESSTSASDGEGAGADFINSSSSLAIFASFSNEGDAAIVRAEDNRKQNRPGSKERIFSK